jgi:heat shock protein HslJ
VRARRSIRPLLVALLGLAGLLVAACGDAEDSTTTTEPRRAAAPLLEHAFVGDDVTVGGEPDPLVDGSELRISFDAEGTLSAGAGCNNMFGETDPEVLDAGRLEVAQLGSTEMACSEELMAQEQWFADLLTTGVSWRYDDASREVVLEGDDVVIRLTDEELVRPVVPFEETAWRSDSLIRGEVVSSTTDDFAATLRFLEDGTVEINSGCNTGSASWTLEDDVLRIEAIALTRMACDNAGGELEAWLLNVLAAHPVTVERLADRLTLTGSEGLGISFTGALAEDVPVSIPGATTTLPAG